MNRLNIAAIAIAAFAFLVPQQQYGLTQEQIDVLDCMKVVYLPDGIGGQMKTLRVHHANLQVVNGTGVTVGSVNGLGNLIVGYQEPFPINTDRTGSHNLIAGTGNSWESFGGVVFGATNHVGAGSWYSTILGGNDNVIADNAPYGTIVAGETNQTTGTERYQTILGGHNNTTVGENSTCVGGQHNTANGTLSTVSGGSDRIAWNTYNWVGGGLVEGN